MDYRVWSGIDYKAAISEHVPMALVPLLRSGQTALEIGCGNGSVTLFLAHQGVKAIGIDLNPDSIAVARQRAFDEQVEDLASFRVQDALTDDLPGQFDLIVLIRVLTCVPDLSLWGALLDRSYVHLKLAGLLYVHDFIMAPELDHYRERYAEGARRGWRAGNFAVCDARHRLLFVAHHHSRQEVDQLIERYSPVSLTFHDSLSMNGNHCRMFEFIGRKPAPAATPG